VQEVFALLVHKLPAFRYDRHRSCRGWLGKITMNKWRDRRRRAAVQPREAGASGPEAAEPDSVAAV
jgi:RNA polymerase sigma-70 factor (ECF subfamily)